jgi:hypothetical protein
VAVDVRCSSSVGRAHHRGGESFRCISSTYERDGDRRSRVVLNLTPGNLVTEHVKRFETRSLQKILATSSIAGGLIHATSGSTGALGGRCRNRMGLAA